MLEHKAHTKHTHISHTHPVHMNLQWIGRDWSIPPGNKEASELKNSWILLPFSHKRQFLLLLLRRIKDIIRNFVRTVYSWNRTPSLVLHNRLLFRFLFTIFLISSLESMPFLLIHWQNGIPFVCEIYTFFVCSSEGIPTLTNFGEWHIPRTKILCNTPNESIPCEGKSTPLQGWLTDWFLSTHNRTTKQKNHPFGSCIATVVCYINEDKITQRDIIEK